MCWFFRYLFDIDLYINDVSFLRGGYTLRTQILYFDQTLYDFVTMYLTPTQLSLNNYFLRCCLRACKI